MTIPQKLTLYTVGLVIATAVVLYLADQYPTSANDAKISHTGDSLRTARAKLDTDLTVSETERQASSDAQRASLAREAKSRLRADAEKRRADSLAVLAAATDTTISQWRMAYDARTVEATELRVQLSESHQRIDSLAADTVRLARDLLKTVTYTQGLERFNADIRRELATRPVCSIRCKLGWLATGVIIDKGLQLATR